MSGREQSVGKQVLVTGASGFVGRTLLPVLGQAGYEVAALVRSESAEQALTAGARPIRGDITDAASLHAACSGVAAVVHLAAHVRDWGSRDEFYRINVEGTRNLLEAARAAGVRKFVHVSTEAVLLDGTPLVNADETRPIPEHPIGLYPWSKALAEKEVRGANGPNFETMVVRPRLIWGKGDTTLTPRLVQAMKSGKFAWIEGGNVLTSTCHVRNVCEGVLCALERGQGGGVYFVTDGGPVKVRDFLGALVRTSGIEPPDKTMPLWLGLALANVVELVWSVLRLSSTPPVTRTAVLLMGNEMTVDDARIREELGYTPAITRENGLAELATAAS
jgi:nucleoside-diphosphate-sugar epimerase